VFGEQLTKEALEALQKCCSATRARRLRLGANAEVVPEGVSELVALPVELVAESAHWSRWLEAIRGAGPKR
jgi:hypothetical protein